MAIKIDCRAQQETSHSTDTAYWNPTGDVLVLLTLLTQLCGPEAEVFFDFGVITIRDVDLGALRRRFEEGQP